MAIAMIDTIEILDTLTGEIESSNVYTCDTAEDLAALLEMDFDEMEVQPGEFVPLSGLIDLEDRF
ncbi:hypothetical protein vBRpoSV10_4 [Ruegeria phage vB_RpoS-V10]|nr:hypothetical protein DSS3P8_004 [Roseobacter phage DSS3P8]AWY09126.1 hypothetical protein vBRpoSV10_4 [Ruegeria phage vB_RpoS-V10]